jgi:hypothetical protein
MTPFLLVLRARVVKWPPTFEAVNTKGAGYWVSLPLTYGA